MRTLAHRRGVGDWFEDYAGYASQEPTFFDYVADYAASGSNAIGQLSDFMLRSSYTVEAIRNALNNVAAVSDADPQIVNYATNEMRYLNENYGSGQRFDPSTGIWIAIGAGVLLLLATRNSN